MHTHISCKMVPDKKNGYTLSCFRGGPRKQTTTGVLEAVLPTEADLPKQLREARVLQPLLEEALRCCDGPAEDLASTPLSPSPRHPPSCEADGMCGHCTGAAVKICAGSRRLFGGGGSVKLSPAVVCPNLAATWCLPPSAPQTAGGPRPKGGRSKAAHRTPHRWVPSKGFLQPERTLPFSSVHPASQHLPSRAVYHPWYHLRPPSHTEWVCTLAGACVSVSESV